MELGNKICELRKNAKLSQEQLAEKLNVTRQTISNWELGQTSPDISQAKEISKIFNISLDELTNNEIQDILVKKITNTEKLTTSSMKILKFLCILIIFVIFVTIILNIISLIKNKNDCINQNIQKQLYQEYRNTLEKKQFHCTINNQEYIYTIFYGKDYLLDSDSLSKISDASEDDTIPNFIHESFKNHIDSRELIKYLQQYFKDNNGFLEEIN